MEPRETPGSDPSTITCVFGIVISDRIGQAQPPRPGGLPALCTHPHRRSSYPSHRGVTAVERRSKPVSGKPDCRIDQRWIACCIASPSSYPRRQLPVEGKAHGHTFGAQHEKPALAGLMYHVHGYLRVHCCPAHAHSCPRSLFARNVNARRTRVL